MESQEDNKEGFLSSQRIIAKCSEVASHLFQIVHCYSKEIQIIFISVGLPKGQETRHPLFTKDHCKMF